MKGEKSFSILAPVTRSFTNTDKTTGKELWRSLSAKDPGYCPPTLITVEGRRQLVIWHPDVSAADPDGVPQVQELIIYCPNPNSPN